MEISRSELEKMIEDAISKKCGSCKKSEELEIKRGLEKLGPYEIEAVKANKLSHYSNRDPKDFIQFDGFVNVAGDDFMKPDADGDCLFSSDTVELMTGNVDVRLLVVPGTSAVDVVRMLDKFKDWIQRDFEQGSKVELAEREPNLTRCYATRYYTDESSLPF